MVEIIITALIVFPVVSFGIYVTKKSHDRDNDVLNHQKWMKKYDDDRADDKAKQLEAKYDD